MYECKKYECYETPKDGSDYCSYHADLYDTNETFSKQIHKANQTMEARIRTLEDAVERLNRELGIK
jgi:hypothetical protein